MTQPPLIDEAQPLPRKSIWKREIVSKKKWRKICVALLCLSFLVWFFQPHLIGMFVLRDLIKDPIVTNTPQPLKDKSVAQAAGAPIMRFGYEFSVPWSNATVRDANSTAVLLSSNGAGFIFFNPANGVDTVGVIKQSATSRYSPQSVFGESTLRSNYDFLADTLNVTPGQLSFLNSRKREARNMTLLVMKSTQIGNSDGSIYSIDLPSFRGFQFGDPASGKAVTVELFDSGDRRLRFLFSSKDHPVTQPQINLILQSLHAAPSSSPQATAPQSS